LVALSAQAPQFFDATFTEPIWQPGAQLPLDPSRAKDVKLKIKPPNTIGAGKCKVTAQVTAETPSHLELGLDITGQPKLDIAGREGVLSTSATAGREKVVPVVIRIPEQLQPRTSRLSGSVPPGWKVTFEPKTIDRIPPTENKEVQALITPTERRSPAITSRRCGRARAASRHPQASGSLWRLGSLGNLGRRPDRHRAVGDAGGGDEVRTAMSDNVMRCKTSPSATTG
jgi:hypothetical protein